jgi:succinate-semialdehyde dehydrogenase/glutarate-semialdehyde dehydrogenase
MKKPISQSVAEIEKCATLCDYYAVAENVLKPEKIHTEFQISEVHHEPLGAILGVMPWNFPFWQAIRFAVPAILAGNTVILKHASICLKVEILCKKFSRKQVFLKVFSCILRFLIQKLKK